MPAAGTLRGTRAISLLVLLVPLIGYAYSSPIQYLPSIPGYVPVYIRYGDEPLEGINPELAEAFGETSNSVKSLQKIDHTLAHESDNFKDDDINTFLEEPKREHDYPLQVRAAESRSFASVNDPRNPNKPKLLNIYTLPDDNDRPRRRYRGRTRTKNSRKPPVSRRPAFKNNPFSDEDKEELEKLAVEVEKEETRPNELYAPNPRHLGSPSENTHSRHKTYDFIAPIKVQIPFDETLTNLPKIPQIADFLQSDQDIGIFEEEKEESPIKGQRPTTLWSNVNKLSPIDWPNETETDKDTKYETEKVKERPLIAKINLQETPQDTDFSKSLDEHNIATGEADDEEPMKLQGPATILSNVDKLSPIDLPNENKTNEKNKTKDFTQPADKVATD